MSSKTRKLIWSVPIVATLAIVGALAAFVALGLPNADPAHAQAAAPGVPTTVQVAPGNMEVVVTWDAPTEDGGENPLYEVRYAQAAAAPTVDSGWTMHPGKNAVRRRVITGLANGTTVYAQVRASNSGGMSAWEAAAAAATPTAVKPSAPTGLMVSQTGAGILTVSWTPPTNDGGAINGITEYDVETQNNCSGGWTDATTDPDPVGASATMAKITGLTADDVLCVRVAADSGATGALMYATSSSVTVGDVANLDLSTLNLHTGAEIGSDSTTGGDSPQLTVTFPALGTDISVGSSVVLYLEDDFQEPSSIPAASIYFVADMGLTGTKGATISTGSGARVYATQPAEIDTDDYFDATKNDISIRVLIPDMCTADTGTATDDASCSGPNGPLTGQRLRMVVMSNSGIKNPSEEGMHSVAVRVVGPTEGVPGPDDVSKLVDLPTVAEVSLSDNNNARGYELLVNGSGFNDKTTATAYVMTADAKPATCQAVVDGGSAVGSATVGSDDMVSVTVTVSVPAFKPGAVNQICLVDGEGRTSGSDVETFELEDSIRVVPATVNAGDTVTIFGQDFKGNAAFSQLDLQGKQVSPARADTTLTSISVSAQSIGDDGSATVTFEMPGSIDGGSVQGVIAVKAY